MSRRFQFWLGASFAVAASLPFLIPGSPFFLPDWLMSSGYHDGHSTRSWMRRLDSPDPEVRRKAAFALGAIGQPASGAVPALAAILADDPDTKARQQAALALFKLAPASESAVPALSRAVHDPDPLVRIDATFALARLGSVSQSAVPALLEALEDADNQTNVEVFPMTVKEAVVMALGRVSAGSTEAVGPLRRVLRSAPTDNLRIAAARALGEIGPGAMPARKELKRLLEHDDPDVREAAQEALDKIDGRTQSEQ